MSCSNFDISELSSPYTPASFPTSFILARDGRVRSVHAGFPGAASGEFHKQTKAEITETVERLLREPAQSSSR